MLELKDITLVGLDCVNMDRLVFAANVCRHYCRFADVKLLTHLECHDICRIAIQPVLNIEAYSRFMIQELCKYVETSHVLIIQHDGFILNPDAWDDDFLNYDYVGAPFWFCDEDNVGNGGFSLRSRRFLEIVSQHLTTPPWSPEDLVQCRTYGRFLKDLGVRFAPEAVARRFALDGNRVSGKRWDGQFGFHNLRTTDLSAWKPPSELGVPPWHVQKNLWQVQNSVFEYLSMHHRKFQALNQRLKIIEERLDAREEAS